MNPLGRRVIASIALGLGVAACASVDEVDSDGVQTDAGVDADGAAGSAAGGGSGGTFGVGGTTASGGTGASAVTGGFGGIGASGGGAGIAGTAGVGSAVGDAGGDADGPCQLDDIQYGSCGACGTRARICDANGTWLEWGACGAEVVGGCTPGEVKLEPCGSKCGVVQYNCSSQCQWLPGACKNEGVCPAGEITVTNASCPAGQIRTNICSPSCAKGNFSACSSNYTWTPLSTLAAPPGGSYCSSVWTGDYMAVAGCYDSTNGYSSETNLYDPIKDQWMQLPAWPSGVTGRREPAIVFTGTELIIWGGGGSSPSYKNDGVRYSFATQQWSTMSILGAPSGRYGMAWAWDNVAGRLYIWGGYGSSPSYKNDGFAYDPVNDSWSPMAASALDGRRYLQSAWDQSRQRLYVWGGYGTSPTYKADGAYYDASSDTWTSLPPLPSDIGGRYWGGAAVAGGKFLFWGGYGTSPSYKSDGAVYDPTLDSWNKLPPSPLAGRYNFATASRGGRVFFWGGTGGAFAGEGAIYDLTSNSWSGVTQGALVNSPSPRNGPTAVWSSQGIIVFGGNGTNPSFKNDGAIYRVP